MNYLEAMIIAPPSNDVIVSANVFSLDQKCLYLLLKTSCALYIQIESLIYHNVCLTERYPNLDKYCEQMKSTYWPDWDECILFPEKQNQK